MAKAHMDEACKELADLLKKVEVCLASVLSLFLSSSGDTHQV
jgi:hypothetical protein